MCVTEDGIDISFKVLQSLNDSSPNDFKEFDKLIEDNSSHP